MLVRTTETYTRVSTSEICATRSPLELLPKDSRVEKPLSEDSPSEEPDPEK
jgi:hypothetical protein